MRRSTPSGRPLPLIPGEEGGGQSPGGSGHISTNNNRNNSENNASYFDLWSEVVVHLEASRVAQSG